MTSNTLTGPDSCAQCGTVFDAAAAIAEFEAAGQLTAPSPAYVTIRGHKIGIPGLYWDRACAGQIESGAAESTLSYKAALDFLEDTWGPMVIAAWITIEAAGDDMKADLAASRLKDILEVSLILETVIEALAQDGISGLDFIPECYGHANGQDPAKAHLS